jgi:glycosyltransferase involved in cell wall biosynthesis
MRIVFQALTAAPGGSINVLAALLRHWTRADKIVCLVWRPEMADILRETGHQVVQVGANSSLSGAWRTMTDCRRRINRWRPDVVFSQQYILPGIRAPHVVHHQNLLRFDPVDSPSLKARARDAAVAATLRRSSINVFNSHFLRAAAIARWPNLVGSRSAVVHNPVEVQDFEQAAHCRDVNTVHILVPQSDMTHKRNVLAVQVLHRVQRYLESQGDPRRAQMTFVGTGEYPQVRAAAAHLGLTNCIRLAGYLTRPELATVYGASDVALITSDKESFCNPVVEAHAAGVPIVTTPLPVFHEISGPLSITAADNGAETLATKVIEALEHAPRAAEVHAAGARYARGFSGAAKAEVLREEFEWAIGG